MSHIRYGNLGLGLLCAGCMSGAPNSALAPPSTPNCQAVAPAAQTGAEFGGAINASPVLDDPACPRTIPGPEQH